MPVSDEGRNYEWEKQQAIDRATRQISEELREQKDIVRKMYSVIIRGLVVLKQLVRIGSVASAYFFLSPFHAYLLIGFILVVGVAQLIIDKTRQVVHPDLKLSEWDVL